MSASFTIADSAAAGQTQAREMRAAVYRGAGRVAVEKVPVPTISEGEVLIRVAACGICGTDIKKIQHGFVAPPQIFGHEVAGTVVEVGRGVRRWKVGDRVVSFHHVPCGRCFYCERRLFSQCPAYKKVGLTAGFEPNGGGFAEYVRAMPWIVAGGMVAIPADVSFEEATFVEPVNTCLKAVEKARVAPGETVLVIGQGPIGLTLMMLARLAGAKVVVSDPMPERRAVSLKLGATAAIDPAAGRLAEEVRTHTEGRGADAVLVAVALSAALSEALANARPGGRVLLFAQNDPHLKIEFLAAAVGVEEKEILGSYSAAVDRQEESARLVFSRTLPVGQLITHRFPLDEFEHAFSLAAQPRKNSLKVLITSRDAY
jgi:L-iditol 2-dehydrogenase